MSAHASASQPGATSSILRPRAWVGGGFIALLALAVWLGSGARDAAAAAECPNEAIRIAQGATHLPDCRAYERVSPADSTGGVVGVDNEAKPMFGAVRADGNAMTFSSSAAIGDSERGALLTYNLARRSAAGWSSFGAVTTSEPNVKMDTSMAPTRPVPSADMTRMLFVPNRSLGPPNPVTVGGSIYLSASEGKGAPTWLSRWTLGGPQPAPSPSSTMALGGSADLSSGYFRYPTPLTTLAGDNLRTSRFGLYFFEGETLSPAGVLPSGIVSPQGALPAGSYSLDSSGSKPGVTPPLLARNQLSADGSTLLFVSPAEGATPKQLYVEEGGQPGRLISHDTAGAPAAAGIVSLEGLENGDYGYASTTRDGSRVVFRSESALTADAPSGGVKTYRAEITPSAINLEYLPAVSGYPVAIDGDASTIAFTTGGSGPEKTSLYVWDEDRPGGAPYTIAEDFGYTFTAVYEPVLTADGSVLVFGSDAEIEPGLAPLPEPNYNQIYRWTKQSETTTCISCRRDGGTSNRFGSRMNSFGGMVTDNPAFPIGTYPNLNTQLGTVDNRKISSDGSRVFFDTSDPLDPARDVNGARDVYMWEDGEVHLLTSGRGSYPSFILDNSASGDDLLMLTMDGMIPSDTNQTYDAYDVRVNGGFDESVEVGCEGDACQAPSVAGPTAPAPASRGVRGPGNQHQTRLGQLKVVQLGKPGASAKVRINVPAAGHVKLAGNLVQNKGQGVKVKGAVTLQLALNKAGKRKLAAKGQLSTKVTATFRDGDGRTRHSMANLRFKQGGHR